MPLPKASATNPILYHERAVWIKGIATEGIFVQGGDQAICSVGAANISRAIGAGGALVYAALYTPAVLTYTRVQLLRATCSLLSASAATVLTISFRTINSAPTGGTAQTGHSIIPTANLPTTLCMTGAISGGAATLGIVKAQTVNIGITGAATVVNPPPIAQELELFSSAWSPFAPSPQSASPSRGWSIVIASTIASTVAIDVNFWYNEIA